MKKSLLLASISLAFVNAALADEATRKAQTELKAQGFYYGEITGELSTETAASIKRFQIRNGLKVTGTLTKESLDALNVGESSPADEVEPRLTEPEVNVPPAKPVPPKLPVPDKNLRKAPAVVAPAPPDRNAGPAAEYEQLFARTPYAKAPREVQQITVRRAQSYLADRGLYQAAITGVPGPALEEALLSFQRRARLPLTGVLDLDTLNHMRLLPGRPIGGGFQPAPQEPPPRRVYRGIWVE